MAVVRALKSPFVSSVLIRFGCPFEIPLVVVLFDVVVVLLVPTKFKPVEVKDNVGIVALNTGVALYRLI